MNNLEKNEKGKNITIIILSIVLIIALVIKAVRLPINIPTIRKKLIEVPACPLYLSSKLR